MTINLDNWKLNLPIDKAGGYSGKAIEIDPIPSDYQCRPFYYKDAPGSIYLSASVECAKTSKNTKYARAELSEQINGKDARWKIKQGGLLYVKMSALLVPTTDKGKAGRIVIGQIHGPDDELCRLYYDNGQMYFYDDKAGLKKKETKFVLLDKNKKPTDIPLADEFSYWIEVSKGSLSVKVNSQGNIYEASEKISSFWTDKECYFKAGCYLQVGKPGSGAGTVGFGKGAVKISEIEVSH